MTKKKVLTQEDLDPEKFAHDLLSEIYGREAAEKAYEEFKEKTGS